MFGFYFKQAGDCQCAERNGVNAGYVSGGSCIDIYNVKHVQKATGTLLKLFLVTA